MFDPYIQGQPAHLSLTVADMSGQPADPGSLTLKVKPPTGVIQSYGYGTAPEVVRDGVGLYHADLDLPVAGVWAYRWELTAPNAGAAEGLIQVQKSRVI